MKCLYIQLIVRPEGRVTLLVQKWQLCSLLTSILQVGKQMYCLGTSWYSLLMVSSSAVPSSRPLRKLLPRRCMGSMASRISVLGPMSYRWLSSLIHALITLLIESCRCINLCLGIPR